MPRLIITEDAARSLERCRKFLAVKNPSASKRAGQSIERQFALLEAEPGIGRPLPEQVELRELVINFGDSGYIALYRFDPKDDAVYVLAFRHQKEAGF